MAGVINNKSDFFYLLAFLLAIGLWFVDTPWISGFDGVDFKGWQSVSLTKFLISVATLAAIIILFLLLKNLGKFEINKIAVQLIFAIQIAAYLLVGGMKNTAAILHILIPGLIVFFVEQPDKFSDDNFLKPLNLLLFIDFILLPLIDFVSVSGWFGSGSVLLRGIRYYAYPYLIYTVASGATRAENSWLKIIFSLILLFFCTAMIVSVSGANLVVLNKIGTANINDFTKATNVFKDAAEFWMIFQLNIISGGQKFAAMFDPNTYNTNYEGTQEETEDPQGVFLKKYDLGDLKYYEGNQVYVWAILEAKTLENRLDIEVRCTAKADDSTEEEPIPPIEGVLDDKTKAKVMKIPVYSGVTTNVICIFDSLKAGEYEINITADFDFGADLPKRIFLMHKDRVMSDRLYLAQQGTDPTPENILIKNNINEIAEDESSTGPVLLQISSDPLIWEIPYSGNPFFGVKVENNWDAGTKVKQIKDIYLKVPEPMVVVGCTQFDPVKVGGSDPQAENGYNTYRIDTPSLIDVEEAIAVGCPLSVNANSLDSEPVTRRFIKAHVDYSYNLEVKIPIEVEKLATI